MQKIVQFPPVHIPIEKIMDDENHPLHSKISETMEKIECGELRMCACMGPGYGEPYCPCEMERRGILFSEARVKETEEAKKRFAELVESGIFSPEK